MDHPLLAIAQPVTHMTGDGIIALFGTPIAHKDHAIRTCHAALAMQDAIRRYSKGAGLPMAAVHPAWVVLALNPLTAYV